MAPTEDEAQQAMLDKQSARQILHRHGDERAAYKLLAHAVGVVPDPDSLVIIANIEMANPLWRQRALDRLKKAVQINPHFTQAWLALGNYWGLRGQLDKQRRCLERILAYEPLNDAVRHSLRVLSGG